MERGTANEEVILVTASADSTHFTCTRGYDGTTGKAHANATSFEHVVVGQDYDEANAHINDSTLHQASPKGTIIAFAGSTSVVPAGWLICDGRAVSRTTYVDLFGVIGTNFGSGDGTTTFNVPDLRGRMIIAPDNMGGSAAGRVTTGSASTLGGTGGVEKITLSEANLPAHQHNLYPHIHPVIDPGHFHWIGYGANIGNGPGPVTGPTYTGAATKAGTTINASGVSVGANTDGTPTYPIGGFVPTPLMNPWCAINYIVKS